MKIEFKTFCMAFWTILGVLILSVLLTSLKLTSSFNIYGALTSMYLWILMALIIFHLDPCFIIITKD